LVNLFKLLKLLSNFVIQGLHEWFYSVVNPKQGKDYGSQSDPLNLLQNLTEKFSQRSRDRMGGSTNDSSY